MTKGAERSGALATEAVWKCGAAGSGAPRKGDLRLPGAAEETDGVGGQTASVAWAGTAQHSGCPDGETGRTSAQRGISRRLTMENRRRRWCGSFTDTRPLTAGRPAAMLHVAAGSYGGAIDDGPFLLEVERGVHFWGGGPRKCGVLRRARAGDGPGAKLLSCRHAARAGITVVRRTDGAA